MTAVTIAYAYYWNWCKIVNFH